MNMFGIVFLVFLGIFAVTMLGVFAAIFGGVATSLFGLLKHGMEFRETLSKIKMEQAQKVADDKQKATSKVAKVLPFTRKNAAPAIAGKTEPTSVPVAEPAQAQTQTASSSTPSQEEQMHTFMASWLRDNTEFDGQHVIIKQEAFDDMVGKAKAAANSQKPKQRQRTRKQNGTGNPAGNDGATDQQNDQE